MGKGDKKTRRGKLNNGSYGVRRRRKSNKPSIANRPTDKKVAEPNAPSPVKKTEAIPQVTENAAVEVTPKVKAAPKPKAAPKAKTSPKAKPTPKTKAAPKAKEESEDKKSAAKEEKPE